MLKPFNFIYTHAIVSRVPNSIKESVFKQKGAINAIELGNAREQHNEYISILRRLGLDVIELQADETLPDSIFIDCNAIILNGIALLTKPYLASRKKETDIVKSILKKEGLNVVEIIDPIATIDASDVLFTGREFFVGISKRTNIIGAKAFAAIFPEIPVSSIKIKRGLFLKAYVTMAGPDLLAISDSDVAKDILKVN
jgi:dimethylargininase